MTGSSHRFLAVPAIQSLFPARAKALAEIEAHHGASTPYGKWCPLTEKRRARNIMAEIAQAWEMKLIAPVFRLARETREFTIALYQFDGISVHFKRREERWKQRIAECVAEEAKRTGIQTALEWKQEEAGEGIKCTGIPIMRPSVAFHSVNALSQSQKGAKMGGCQ